MIIGEPGMAVTNLERESLEAHVDLCALRYAQLDTRLNNLEEKVETIHQDILDGQKSLSKVIITTAGTIIAGVISIVIAVLMKIN